MGASPEAGSRGGIRAGRGPKSSRSQDTVGTGGARTIKDLAAAAKGKNRATGSEARRAQDHHQGRTGPSAPRSGAAREAAQEGWETSGAVYKLTRLDQIKVLADPLRIRILELLCEERTTKQVAEILGQPPTRLYHHVAALERVGLIRLARTRQSRGALEKYYIAVAKAFSADSRLFSSLASAEVVDAAHDVGVQILESTAGDLRALLESGQSLTSLENAVVLSFLEVRGTPKELTAMRRKLMKILKDCTEAKGKPAQAGPGYRLTIAYFPLAGRSHSS